MLVLFIVMFIGIIYKSSYHRNAPNVDKLPGMVFSLNKFFSPGLLFPLRQRPNNELDNINRKKANKALYIFYLSFILILILSRFIN
jgi:hypothetical protein